MGLEAAAAEAVLTWKYTRSDTLLISFVGFASYYREFIKGYANKVYPMQQMVDNEGKHFEWKERAQEIFDNIKRGLCKAPVLGLPTEKSICILYSDASLVCKVR